MRFQTNEQIKNENRARILRTRATDAESQIWKRLRARQISNARFRRQHPIENFIVDFVSFDANLIIEIDGGQHADQTKYDAKRSEYLERCGFKVLRFWNNEVFEQFDAVLEKIHLEVVARYPFPLPTSPLKGEEQNPAHSEALATASPPLQGEG